jgi:hypothetical protein
MTRYTLLKTFCALSLAATGASAQTATHNVLTAEEAASGYVQLFNGTNLTGWRAYNNLTPPSSWAVVAESTWNVIKNGAGSAVPLITIDSTYQNFDFKVEYLVPSAGNAGIFIRYNQYGKDSWGGASGPEAQIAAINNSDGTSTLHRMGACYDMFPLLNSSLNWDKTGANGVNYEVYHQFRIIAFNNRVAHYGNGIKLLEYDMTTPAYTQAYNASKYSTYPIYKTIHQGGLYLQHHGEQNVRFRDLRVKKLTTSPWAQGSPYLSNPSDSSSGLKSTLTFNENLFPTALAPGRNANPSFGTRVLRGTDGISLLLDRAGDYHVQVSDLRGRTTFRGELRRGDRMTLPASAFTGETRVLSIQPMDGSAAYRELISPIQ